MEVTLLNELHRHNKRSAAGPAAAGPNNPDGLKSSNVLELVMAEAAGPAALRSSSSSPCVVSGKSYRHLCPLRMSFESVPRFRGEFCLAVNGFVQRFGAAGTADALEPAPAKRLFDHIQAAGGGGGFFFLTGGMSDPDEEPGQ